MRILVLALTVITLFLALWQGRNWIRAANSRSFQQECVAATRRQDWDKLYEKALTWRRDQPDNDTARLYLAEACVQKDLFDEADQLLAEIKPDFKRISEVYAVHAELLFSTLNRPKEAVELWQKELKLIPQADVPRQRLVYWYSMTLQRQEMIQLIMESIQLGAEPPEAYTYLFLSNDLNFSDALPTVSRWRSQYPDDVQLEIAQAVFAARQTSDNLLPTFGASTVRSGDQSLLQRCLTKYPGALEPLALAIEQAIFSGDVDQVLSLVKQVATEGEGDSRFWRFRGWILTNQGRFEEAEKSYREALKITPWDWSIRLFLSEVLRKLGKTVEAEAEALIAQMGKDLKGEILTSPNARELSPDTVEKLLQYFEKTGPPEVAEGMKRRIE